MSGSSIEYTRAYNEKNYMRVKANLPKVYEDEIMDVCGALKITPARLAKCGTLMLMEKIREDLDNGVAIGEIKHRYGMLD